VTDAAPQKNARKVATAIEVLFGTNRIPRDKDKDKGPLYGNTRGQLIFGLAKVSVPPNRKLGTIPEPAVIGGYEMEGYPLKHFLLMSAPPRDPRDIAQITDQFFREKPGKRRGFVFVHGYNVSFRDAAFRTAQMALDMKLTSMPVFFSWASKAGFKEYWQDENTALQSVPDFKKFLTTYLEESKVEHVVIVAHSMGSRLVTSALVEMIGADAKIAKKLHHLVLAAPDLDAAVFKEQVMPVLARQNIGMTVYASSRDRALATSVKMHGFTRVGSAGKDIVIGDGVETVDASLVDTDFLGHSYFASAPFLLKDISALIATGQKAELRLSGYGHPKGSLPLYWRLKP
jgi:esterase/lipase superfamily enzyme